MSRPKQNLTNDSLARIYRTSARQVARWKASKAPLLSVPEMMLWFSARADMPNHLRSLDDGEQAVMQADIDALTGGASKRAAAKTRASADPVEVAKLPQGAEHALRRLQGEEPRLFAAMMAAEGDNQLLLASSLRKQWKETLLSLKQFESLVEADKRDSGETITRAQMLPVLTTLAVWLRRGIEDAINGASLLLAEADTPQRVYATIADPCRRSLSGAVDAATGDGKLPGWVREALAQGL